MIARVHGDTERYTVLVPCGWFHGKSSDSVSSSHTAWARTRVGHWRSPSPAGGPKTVDRASIEHAVPVQGRSITSRRRTPMDARAGPEAENGPTRMHRIAASHA